MVEFETIGHFLYMGADLASQVVAIELYPALGVTTSPSHLMFPSSVFYQVMDICLPQRRSGDAQGLHSPP
jgi:hypothetical protein